MKSSTIFMLCLTIFSAAFWIGVASGAWSANSLAVIRCEFVGEVSDQHKPPAGQQFDDGPVIVRAQGSAPTIRFIF